MGKKIIEFQEHASPITCIQFHPFEFLIAAGRNDGTVDLYDLESKKLISRTGSTSAFNGHTVKCITFSENGECLFVGTAEGISVIGWEPDREFDHIESEWSILGDMKVVKTQLFCGSYEQQVVKIHDIQIDQVIPFYNPTNTPFSHNQSSRKSFTRSGSSDGGRQKLRLSIGKSKKKEQESPTHSAASSGAGGVVSPGQSSPHSLSFEMIDETEEHGSMSPAAGISNNGFIFETIVRQRDNSMFSQTSTPDKDFIKRMPPTAAFNDDAAEHYLENYTSDLDYYPMRSSPASRNVVEPEREDFPVTNAQPPDYAPKVDIAAHHLATNNTTVKSSLSISKAKAHIQQQQHQQRRHSPPNTSSRSMVGQQRKLSSVQSVSTMDLHRIDDNMTVTVAQKRQSALVASTSRSRSPVRNYISSYTNGHNNATPYPAHHNGQLGRGKRGDAATTTSASAAQQLTRENNIKNKKITVQIYTPPPKAQTPTRSKTSLDFRAPVASITPSSPSLNVSVYLTKSRS